MAVLWQERANLQLEALLEARRMAALGAARQVAATPSANSGHSYAAPESNSMNAEPGAYVCVGTHGDVRIRRAGRLSAAVKCPAGDDAPFGLHVRLT